MAVGNRNIMRRRSSAFVIPCLDRNRGEACPKQLIANPLDFEIAMRGSGHKIGWVLWKEGREYLGNNAGKLVLRNSIPCVEKEMAARLQDAERLSVTLYLVGKEHHAKLTRYDVEPLILEWQR